MSDLEQVVGVVSVAERKRRKDKHKGVVHTVLVQALSPVLLLSPQAILFIVAKVSDVDRNAGLFGLVYWVSKTSFLFNPLVDAVAALYFVPSYRQAFLVTVGLKKKKTTKVVVVHRRAALVKVAPLNK